MESKSWGIKGDPTKWVVDISNLSPGSSVDLVANVVSSCDDGTVALVVLFPCSTKARVLGLSESEQSVDAISVYGITFLGHQGLPTFQVESKSLVMHFPKPSFDDLLGLREACAGMGFATEGFQQAGFQPRVANELRESNAFVYKQMHQDVHIVVGDIDDSRLVWQMWDSHRKASPIFAGFSCQPFSKGGQQRGAEDTRAFSLVATIKAAFMLRAPVIVLECVKDASQNNFVLQTLQDFCSQCRFHRTEVILALEDCWAGKRERWWSVLSAQFLGPIKLRPFPVIPSPSKLHQIHPAISLTPDDVKQLELTVEEFELLLQYVGDPKCMVPQWNSKAPTALHSWGSQLTCCPCGCRDLFSPQTLSRGIYGKFLLLGGSIEIDGQSYPRMRHPHPFEVAAWNCLLPKDSWPLDHRLMLSGLGQMAIPLQSSWIACQVRQHLDFLFWGKTMINCDEVFEHNRQQVMQFVKNSKEQEPSAGTEQPSMVPVGMQVGVVNQVVEDMCVEPPILDEIFPFSQQVVDHLPLWVGTPHCGDAASFTLVDPDVCRCMQISLASPQHACVGHVIAAEIGMNPTRGYLSLVDCITQQEVAHDQLVAGRSLCLQEELTHWGQDHMNPDWDGYDLPDQIHGFDDVEMSPTLQFEVVDPQPGVNEEYGKKGCEVSSIDDGVVDPLCHLAADMLLKVDPPCVSTIEVLSSLLYQQMPAAMRLQVLANQGNVWADDEIRFHIESLLAASKKLNVGFLDPLLLVELVQRPSCALINAWWKSFEQSPTVIVGVVGVHGHWIPFHCTWTVDCFYVASWDDGPSQWPRCLRVVFDLLSKHVGSRTVSIRVEHRRFPTNHHCGVCAVRYIDHVVRGRMLPSEFHEVRSLHEQGRQRFIDHIESCVDVPRPWQWGAGLDNQSLRRLHDLLKQHGVPDQQIATRSHLIVQMIGLKELQGALHGSTAWRALKSLANKCTPPLQLVLAEELNTQIQQRAKDGKIGAKRTKKGNIGGNHQPVGPPKLDPGKLALEQGVFAKSDGTPLCQISIDSISAFAEGVVIGTVTECSAYLHANQCVNNLSLGLFIINATPSEVCTKLPCEEIRIPLRCVVNREPMLVSGHLVQLGSQPVKLVTAKPVVDIDAPSAICVKIAVYRDAIEGSWADFCKAPIKCLLNHVPALTKCEDSDKMDCSCPKWHPPPKNSMNDPILDVWRRQWVTMQFRPAAMEASDMFLVNVRCFADQEVQLLGHSGLHGVYIEPRSIDAKEANQAYQVIWLSNIPVAEAVRLKQCNPLVLGLARIGSRLGLRVKSDDAEEVGKAVRPGAIILSVGPKEFEVGPLPFGMDRLSVSRMCGAWGWQVRPLHAIRVVNGQQGSIWLVQSSVEPSDNVFPMKHGNVLVSKLQPKESQSSQQKYEIVGSSATVEMCRLKDAGSKPVDSLQLHDPWSNYVNKVHVPPTDGSSGMGIRQVEERIEKAVLAKIPTSNVGDDTRFEQMHSATESRFAALEQQVTLLTTQHESMEKQLEASGKHQDAQLNQLRVQVKAQLDAQGHQMESLFKQQMANIEGLLSKRSRSRGRHE